jgi:hypothetical protein
MTTTPAITAWDEFGNPITPSPKPAVTYLDDNGNPLHAAPAKIYWDDAEINAYLDKKGLQ